MVHQIPTNTLEIHLAIQTELFEVRFRADTAVHKDEGRVVGTSAQDDFLFGTERDSFLGRVGRGIGLGFSLNTDGAIFGRAGRFGFFGDWFENDAESGSIQQNIQIRRRFVMHKVGAERFRCVSKGVKINGRVR